MEWYVIDTVVSPSVGVCFSCIRGFKNLKLTIWYQADIFLAPGSMIEPYDKGVLINGKVYPITVYNVNRYNKELWICMKEKSLCPGSQSINNKYCNVYRKCMVSICPFGLLRQDPEDKITRGNF
ncbi:anti-adapter protein IraM [Salmonella enterica]|nr:anti-adapter protein IraM [Salmonella enterica]